jgi:hypothetical protein
LRAGAWRTDPAHPQLAQEIAFGPANILPKAPQLLVKKPGQETIAFG